MMRGLFAKKAGDAESAEHFVPKMFLKAPIAILCVALAVALPAPAEDLISIRGAQVAAEPVNAAAEQFQKETGLKFRIISEGGNARAVTGIGEDVVDVALLSRKITQHEFASWPERHFTETQFGMQALVIIVPDQIWNAGVHALTKDQVRDIYEGQVKNWKSLGGQDRKVVFYNRDVRGSAWELLATFLYEDTRKAPMSDAEALTEPSDVTTAVEYNSGSISFLEYAAPRPATMHALGIRLPDGKVVEPTPANIASGRYELARPLVIATARKPAGNLRRFVDFMLGPTGQSFLKKRGHLSNTDLGLK